MKVYIKSIRRILLWFLIFCSCPVLMGTVTYLEPRIHNFWTGFYLGNYISSIALLITIFIYALLKQCKE